MTNDEQALPASANSLAMTLVEEEADSSIRRQLHDGRMFFSLVDVIGVLTGSARPRKYWNDLKTRLSNVEGFSELPAKIGQLKMLSQDGKRYTTDATDATDATDTETLLRIIQSVPSPKAEPVKQWLARIGAQHLDATIHPLPSASASNTDSNAHEAGCNGACALVGGIL
ncbi:MAG: hypothetical protein ABI068_08460 [Ktedonobacterales bacterium]